MSDYAVLLTASLTVLEYGVYTRTTCTHAVTTLRALKASDRSRVKQRIHPTNAHFTAAPPKERDIQLGAAGFCRTARACSASRRTWLARIASKRCAL